LALITNRTLTLIAKLTISSVLLYFVLSKTGFGKVLITLKGMSLPAMIAAILLYILAQFISTVRWKLLLPEIFGIKKLFSLYMIGAFFNTILPSVIGGDAIKGLFLYRETGKGGLTLASIFMDRYIGFVVLILICAAAFPFGYKYFHGSRVEWLLPVIVISFIIASFLIFGLRLGKSLKMLSGFYDYFRIYRNQKEVMIKASLLSLLIQIFGILSVYILSLGIGQHIPFIACLIFIPLIIMFTTLPVSISGIGVREGAFVLFFNLIGIKPEVSTAISLSWFISMTAGSLLGLIEYLRYKKENIVESGINNLSIGDNQKIKK
jgi:uncharacterized membrane protein YbhN (UPF0104 family)